MKIILYKDVPRLGEEGDVLVVADGYARNYLIPKKFAVLHSKATEVELQQKHQAITRRREAKQLAARSFVERLASETLEISLPAGAKGKLFGSVTAGSIVESLAAKGIEVERKKVELPSQGIKVLGTHTAKVKLYGGTTAEVKIEVTPLGDKTDEEQAAAPAEKEAPPLEAGESQPVEEAGETSPVKEASQALETEKEASSSPDSEEEALPPAGTPEETDQSKED